MLFIQNRRVIRKLAPNVEKNMQGLAKLMLSMMIFLLHNSEQAKKRTPKQTNKANKNTTAHKNKQTKYLSEKKQNQ